jgi:hypothetical protein
VTGNAANRVVVYPRVDYPLCWCCVAGSLGVMSANGLSYTVGKTPEQRASSANCRNSVGQMDATVANPQPPLFTVSSSSVFQLFRPDGRE